METLNTINIVVTTTNAKAPLSKYLFLEILSYEYDKYDI
jgi:hypothetical protein